MSSRIPTHPGQILLKEFLEPSGITQVALADRVGASPKKVNEIIRGKRGIAADTAIGLAEALGTTAEFWMNLQLQYDLALARKRRRLSLSPHTEENDTRLQLRSRTRRMRRGRLARTRGFVRIA